MPTDRERQLERALLRAIGILEDIHTGNPFGPVTRTSLDSLRRSAGVVDAPLGTPEQRRDAGIERALRRWTDEEVKLVDEAIVAAARASLEPTHAHGSTYAAPVGTFTADDVWRQLDGAVEVTKGLAGRLLAASNRGTIRNTGATAISTRNDEHGHGQRLTVWAPA